ncbi:energy transducer TonB [Mucilaginibacter auburnensis]|uniref:TonB family protein n=1 Tax=Mucilaginibacter auburnensis TaxID=1457233 RepID=A0A2H9VNE0_9SPHI|nr:energy transducer TonB [Mucilaginibacter auburnensis]PJJ79842.1 TonB family protein [Mucilaginibacter auburnensis]
MLKYLFCLISLTITVNAAFAQAKSDTLIYYAKDNNSIIDDKTKADYVVFILPQQKINNNKLYPVMAYYPNGVLKLSAMSKTQSANFELQGPYIAYFPNGKRKLVATVDKGVLVGDEIAYYPNGNLYSHIIHKQGQIILNECRDSTGTILAQNGNGIWLDFPLDFYSSSTTGPVKDGLRDGKWQLSGRKALYEKGRIAKILSDSTQLVDLNPKAGKNLVFENDYLPIEGTPVYTGGKLHEFIYKNLVYPEQDRKDSIGGQAFIGFSVEQDGTTSNFKIIKAPSATLGEEALRVAKLLTQFNPGIKKGKPVKSPFVLPIYFSLDSLLNQQDTTSAVNFSGIDEQPSFPGGLGSFAKFLEKAIRYPVKERENHVTGKVYTSFIVEKDGSLTNIHVVATPSIGLAEEALRVFGSSPKWVPAKVNGKLIRVKHSVPINFSLGVE